MKNYLLSLVAVAAIAALSGFLTSDGGKSSGVSLVTGLCVLSVAVFPIVRGVQALTDAELPLFSPTDERERYEEIFENSLRENGGGYLAERLTRLLSERYACDVSCFSVRLALTENGQGVESVTVLLSGRAVFLNTYDLEEYISGLLGCPCETAVGS